MEINAAELLPAEWLRGPSHRVRDLAFSDGYMAHFHIDTAKQLGVDPYSDNLRLQQEMDKVTWAFFAGGLPLRIGAAVASAGVAVAATNMVGVPEETYALTQSEPSLRDHRSLTAMGLKEEHINAFQIQPSLSTTRRHRRLHLLRLEIDARRLSLPLRSGRA